MESALCLSSYSFISNLGEPPPEDEVSYFHIPGWWEMWPSYIDMLNRGIREEKVGEVGGNP